MNFYLRGFNTILLLAAGLPLAAGCAWFKKEEKQTAILRIHIESSATVGEGGKTISVLRVQPVLVPINADPVLTEANIIAATLLETAGGFAVEVKFDESGTLVLEQYSSANPGKHFAIFGQWSEKAIDSRWLAAPIITRRNATGIFAFTPDASREEATQLVLGLNSNAKQMLKGKLK
jgi:preprotein translocase subunit SecD